MLKPLPLVRVHALAPLAVSYGERLRRSATGRRGRRAKGHRARRQRLGRESGHEGRGVGGGRDGQEGFGLCCHDGLRCQGAGDARGRNAGLWPRECVGGRVVGALALQRKKKARRADETQHVFGEWEGAAR